MGGTLSAMDFEQIQTYILVGLGIASAVVPLLRHLAGLTASKTDDEHVERIAKLIHDALGYVPTIEVTPALTKDDKDALKAVKEEESK